MYLGVRNLEIMAAWRNMARRMSQFWRSTRGVQYQSWIMNGLVWIYPTGYILKNTLLSSVIFPSLNAIQDSHGLPERAPDDIQAMVEEVCG